jgi:uroporphyrin-III C-methyltransferase
MSADSPASHTPETPGALQTPAATQESQDVHGTRDVQPVLESQASQAAPEPLAAQPAQGPETQTSAPLNRSDPANRRRYNWPAYLIALVALALVAWVSWDTRRQSAAMQQELARRLNDVDNVSKQNHAIALEAQEVTHEAQNKTAALQNKFVALENKLSESQNQQVALEALYQELSRTRDEWSLAEVEQILTIANQQLQLAGNVKAALIALQAADARLQRIDKPQLAALRKVLDQDIERLKALPFLDTVGISVRLENLSAGIDALPLLSDARPITDQAGEKTSAQPGEPFWTRIGRDTWAEIKQLVRVQHMERPEAPLLSPTQSFFLRENLRLRLLSARLALLSRDEASYKADLKAAQDWLARFYDSKDKAQQNALASLHLLYASPIGLTLPDISGSLEAVHSYRLTRESTTQ